MPRRFVDLSICLENDVLSDPPPLEIVMVNARGGNLRGVNQ